MSKKVFTVALLLTALAAAGEDPAKLKEVADNAIDLAKDQEAALENAANEVVSLQAENDSLKSGKKILPSFKHAKTKKTYEVLHGVKLEGVDYTAAQIAEKVAVQNKLVEGGSSAVAEVIEVTE